MTGMFPDRMYKVVHGSFPKKGWLKENQWKGLLLPKDMPHVLNPDKGYLATNNNFATSDKVKYGFSHGYSMPHRAIRANEMLSEMIA
mmetsp:Transcript_8709/g.6459  ORF Transcript_8709/g.6459 Transcript_8709/m.6459 type:complete len:87 (-) Transcript_8709:392-652(-)